MATSASPSYDSFDGGGRLRGTVRTNLGADYEGWIEWDRDETHDWQTLDGEATGIDWEIPFRNIKAITPTGPGGCDVTLTNGRTLSLSGSNDVNRSNRGIVVHRRGDADETVTVTVEWDELVELTLD